MRPGCPNRAVATLTYNYADSIAVVGPLSLEREPHSWDLCATHALRISTPRGWNLVRHPDLQVSEDPDLTALLDAVIDPATPPAGAEPAWVSRLNARGGGRAAESSRSQSATPPRTPGVRGHLRVVHPSE